MSEADPKSMFGYMPDLALEARLDAEAEAAFSEGRLVAHDKVMEWLGSWGMADELSCPKPE